MNYEYNASGSISINEETQCETDTQYLIEFIDLPIAFIPNRKVFHTSKYSILLNGGMATCGFNDKIQKISNSRIGQKLYPFFVINNGRSIQWQ